MRLEYADARLDIPADVKLKITTPTVSDPPDQRRLEVVSSIRLLMITIPSPEAMGPEVRGRITLCHLARLPAPQAEAASSMEPSSWTSAGSPM